MSLRRMLVFLGVVLGLDVGIHSYLWMRLVRDPAWPEPVFTAATVGVALLALLIPASFVMMRAGLRDHLRERVKPLMWAGYLWMGAMFLLFMGLLPTELVRLTAGFAGPELGEGLLLPRALAGVVLVGGFGAAALGVATALKRVGVREVPVPIKELPEGLRGLSIVQLTDVHVGPTIGKEFVEQLVERVNALSPDLVAITGDLVDGPVERLGPMVEPLRHLKARHGVFFVTGNHEYYSGAESWIAFLEGLGIRVLRNERVTIEHEGEKLDVAGVDDWTARGMLAGHGHDLKKALRGRERERKLLLLAHQPKVITEAAEEGVDLVLSGHTHGGQIMPFNYFVYLQQPYVAGLHEHGGTQLYVSRGTGYWGPPMRVGVPAEITRLVLA